MPSDGNPGVDDGVELCTVLEIADEDEDEEAAEVVEAYRDGMIVLVGLGPLAVKLWSPIIDGDEVLKVLVVLGTELVTLG